MVKTTRGKSVDIERICNITFRGIDKESADKLKGLVQQNALNVSDLFPNHEFTAYDTIVKQQNQNSTANYSATVKITVMKKQFYCKDTGITPENAYSNANNCVIAQAKKQREIYKSNK